MPIRPFVQDTGLIDIEGESSLQLASLDWIVGEAAMLEVVEEWLKPIALLHDVRRDGVDLVVLWNELQDCGKKPPFFNDHLRGFTVE